MIGRGWRASAVSKKDRSAFNRTLCCVIFMFRYAELRFI
jgi:hypothetical protein